MVITSTEDVASVHGSFPSALCNEDRPIREPGAGVVRLCAVSQLTTGYRGNRNWRDMSEYAVHFTKPAATSSPYDVMIKILWEGRINAVTPLGAARKLAHLGDSQKTACFSEIPLDLLGRLIVTVRPSSPPPTRRRSRSPARCQPILVAIDGSLP